MIVGELRHGQLIIIDRLRETVRLAEGLSGGVISDDARTRALDCLSQFGERLRAMRAASVCGLRSSISRAALRSFSMSVSWSRSLTPPSGFPERGC